MRCGAVECVPARVMVTGEARRAQLGRAPLHIAAGRVFLPVVEALLRAGADVTAVDGVRARRACGGGVRACVVCSRA